MQISNSCFWLKSFLTVLLVMNVVAAQQAKAQVQDSTFGVNDWVIEAVLEQLMELVPEEELEDSHWEDLIAFYLQKMEQPADLNAITPKELSSFHLLTPFQIQQIIQYRTLTGGFGSILELQAIHDLDLEVAKFLSQFLKVTNESELVSSSVKEVVKKSSHEVILRTGRVIEKQLGYQIKDTTRSRYLGTPERILLRYRMHWSPELRFNLTMEKDAGERLGFRKNTTGFDAYSFSLEITKQRYMNQFIIGDYQLQVGQGLSVWGGYAMGKGAILHGIARIGQGFKMHTSSDEIRFFRGVALEIERGNLLIRPYVSFRNRDGNLQEVDGTIPIVESLGTSGLHRTPNELNNKNQVKQRTVGLNLEYVLPLLRVGVHGYYNRFNAQLSPPDLLRNKFKFSGQDEFVGTIYSQFNYRNLFAFNEFSKHQQSGSAFLQGLLISMHPKFNLGLLYRNYSKDYHGMFAQAFGNSSLPSNEQGMYLGFQYQINRRSQLLFYVDQYRFPWAKYRVDGPSVGYDAFMTINYAKSRQQNISLRVKHKIKQLNEDVGTPHYLIMNHEQWQIRLHFEKELNLVWKIRNRFEWSIYEKELYRKEHGWLIYQDLFYQPIFKKWRGNLRIAYYNTDSYDTRIYAYENNVMYASGVVPYHQKGIRGYLNFKIRWNAKFECWARYSVSYSMNDAPIGSGLDEILNQPYKSDLTLQLRIKI